jgi:Protein of unknown function (DUF4229)
MPSPTSREPGLAVTVLLYTLARLGLVAVVAGLLVIAGVPVLLAVLLGLIVALPLSMVLFKGLRVRLDAAIAVSGARRSAEREALRARLRGEDDGVTQDAVPNDAGSNDAGTNDRASDDADQR